MKILFVSLSLLVAPAYAVDWGALADALTKGQQQPETQKEKAQPTFWDLLGGAKKEEPKQPENKGFSWSDLLKGQTETPAAEVEQSVSHKLLALVASLANLSSEKREFLERGLAALANQFSPASEAVERPLLNKTWVANLIARIQSFIAEFKKDPVAVWKDVQKFLGGLETEAVEPKKEEEQALKIDWGKLLTTVLSGGQEAPAIK